MLLRSARRHQQAPAGALAALPNRSGRRWPSVNREVILD
jgi:hypothetical protein